MREVLAAYMATRDRGLPDARTVDAGRAVGETVLADAEPQACLRAAGQLLGLTTPRGAEEPAPGDVRALIADRVAIVGHRSRTAAPEPGVTPLASGWLADESLVLFDRLVRAGIRPPNNLDLALAITAELDPLAREITTQASDAQATGARPGAILIAAVRAARVATSPLLGDAAARRAQWCAACAGILAARAASTHTGVHSDDVVLRATERITASTVASDPATFALSAAVDHLLDSMFSAAAVWLDDVLEARRPRYDGLSLSEAASSALIAAWLANA